MTHFPLQSHDVHSSYPTVLALSSQIPFIIITFLSSPSLYTPSMLTYIKSILNTLQFLLHGFLGNRYVTLPVVELSSGRIIISKVTFSSNIPTTVSELITDSQNLAISCIIN